MTDALFLYWACQNLQNLDQKDLPFLVTLNPSHEPQNTLLKWCTGHPIPSVAALKASLELDQIQGKRGIWFCGAYQGEPFHFYISAGDRLLSNAESITNFFACNKEYSCKVLDIFLVVTF